MERFIRKIKDRTECFDDDHLLCRKLIAVKTSTTLTWTNDDTLPHTVTSGMQIQDLAENLTQE
jgi:hypothetical protein